MKWLVLLLISQVAIAQTRVAIIDTGLDLSDIRFKAHLCKDGHYNYADDNNNTKDLHGHGTHVAGIIKENAGNSDYCLIIIKFYKENQSGKAARLALLKSIAHAYAFRANVINFSGGGPGYDKLENDFIKNSDALFIVAAGNDDENLDCVDNAYYPACYYLKNIIVVGALKKDLTKLPSSNYGNKINYWEVGEKVWSTLPDGKYGEMTGTSMSTATRTGKYVKEN